MSTDPINHTSRVRTAEHDITMEDPVDPPQESQPTLVPFITPTPTLWPLPPSPTPQVEPVGQTEVPLSMADFNRNFIIRSLQGSIPCNSYDLDDFDEDAVAFIAHAVAQDRVILARVLRIYFELKRRESIVNPSAFIIGTLQRELAIKKSREGSWGYVPRAADCGHWLVARLASALRAVSSVKSRYTNPESVIDRLYKNLQLDSRILDVGGLYTILLVPSQNLRSWHVTNTCSLIEDMARFDADSMDCHARSQPSDCMPSCTRQSLNN